MIFLGLLRSEAKPVRRAALPLDRVHLGSRVKVTEVGCGKRYTAMLAQRGVRVNETLSVCHRAPLGGPVWVERGGAMFAIGRAVAHKILVTELQVAKAG